MSASYQSVAAASATGGTDPTVATPSGTADGDLLVCCAGSTGAITPPSGGGTGAAWNEYIVSGVSGAGCKLLWKNAASEPANYTFGISGIGNSVIVIARITGHDPAAPIDDAKGVTGSLGNVVLPQVTSSGADRLLFQFLGRLANVSFTEPGGVSERFDAASSSANYRYAGGDEVVGSGATGSRTWTPSSGTAGTSGFMLAIKPAIPPEEGTFSGGYDFTGSFTGQAGPGQGTFSGGYDFAGSGFTGQAGPGTGTFVGSYDFTGSNFEGEAPDIAQGTFAGSYSFVGSNFVGDGDPTGDVGTLSDIARRRAALYLSITEPTLSRIATNTLLRQYWATRAGIGGDLSTYTIADIMEEHFPQFDYIKDVF